MVATIDKLSEMGRFTQQAERQMPSEATLARYAFREWKELYTIFREVEGREFYGKTPPNEKGMREHRQAVAFLLGHGEQMAGWMSQIAQEREIAEMREEMEGFLQALRESLEVWHPANGVPEIAGMKSVFG